MPRQPCRGNVSASSSRNLSLMPISLSEPEAAPAPAPTATPSSGLAKSIRSANPRSCPHRSRRGHVDRLAKVHMAILAVLKHHRIFQGDQVLLRMMTSSRRTSSASSTLGNPTTTRLLMLIQRESQPRNAQEFEQLDCCAEGSRASNCSIAAAAWSEATVAWRWCVAKPSVQGRR